jgi:glycosyltransferase involved in cell wall biosynthesis
MKWRTPLFTSSRLPCEIAVKVLLVHNHYLHPGGEDQVFSAEAEVLQAHGDEIRTYTVHNSRVASMGKLSLAKSTIWNQQVLHELTAILQQFEPAVVHCHNTFPLISPSAYAAAHRLGIPVIQTLHNFRLLCLNGLFLREGRLCEDCLGRDMAWPGVRHACYRQSREASVVVASMLAIHRLRRTWETSIDTYIALSEFARAKFVAGGLPADRIVVKPNFLEHDPGLGAHQGGFALYVGRLSPEKGIAGMLQLWRRLAPAMTLRIIGSGPLETLKSDSPPNVEWLGWQSRERVLAAMKDASFLLFPTECYEGFPIVLLEAMATGLPVIASRQGSLPEIVQEGVSGLLPSNAGDEWADALRWAMGHPAEMEAMGHSGRRAFESHYTPAIGYQLLSEVYQQTIERSHMALRHSVMARR